MILSQDDILVLPLSGNETYSGEYVHLYVRKRGDIQSIGLYIDTDNYNDPDLSIMRSKFTNPVNSKEKRYSNGKKNDGRTKLLPDALICSTVSKNEILGNCFHILISKEMYYGYVIQAQNECTFENGMSVNIRTYSKAGLDSSSEFQNNKLTLIIADSQSEKTFATISERTEGKEVHINSISELTEKLVEEIESLENHAPVQIVFAIDTTASMQDDFVELRKNWLEKFEKQFKNFSDIEVGIVFYKDYGDEFRTNNLPAKVISFTKSFSSFANQIKKVNIKGGGDKEEAVFEALHLCSSEFKWNDNSKKKIILIGDAGAHTPSNSNFRISESEILERLFNSKITVDCFLISESETNFMSKKNVKKDEITSKIESSVEELNTK